jgi:hypothetical protein
VDRAAFDRFTTSLAAAGTRRALLRLLSVLPLGGALAAALAAGPTAADPGDPEQGSSRRRHRRKTRNARQSGDDKHNRKGQRKGQGKSKKGQTSACRPESTARTCAGKCATVVNNCGTRVDCGPCACGSCPECWTCDTKTGKCIPNDAVVGQDCGSAGQVCQGDGSCACALSSCPDCQTCDAASGACVQDANQDEDCCGIPGGGTWCQSGQCVTATATLADCGGRCDGGSVAICGQPAACPACSACSCTQGLGSTCLGSLGTGAYCVGDPSGEPPGSPETPCPSGQARCGSACRFTCT